MAHLVVRSSPESGQPFDLNRDETAIGRHPDCRIVLTNAPTVSRFHARILRDGEDYYLQDLDSRNGTYLNDERITPQEKFPLKNGDTFSVGDVEFTFNDSRPALVTEAESSGEVADACAAVESLRAILDDDEDSFDTGSSVLATLDLTTGSDENRQVSGRLTARLSALIEITRSLGKALALDKVLPQVLNSVFLILPQADRGIIVLRTRDGTLAPRWAKSRRQNDDGTVRISRTIVKKVMESKEAMLYAPKTRDNRLDVIEGIAGQPIRSMMYAPLVDSEGNSLGVIQVDTADQRKQFRQDDLEILASVAVQAGIAVFKAQLFETALRQKEIEQDLELAQEMYKAFLPQSRPRLHGYEFFDYRCAANHIGGDYYDYIPLPDGRTAAFVADVVGHGIAAAAMMAKVADEMKYCLHRESHPAAAIASLNDRLSYTQVDRFVTLLMIVLDSEKHEVTIVNAGHSAPIWRRADGTIEEPGEDVSGLPVGIMEGMDYEQITIPLAPGESLTMYTDGVIEALSPAGDQFTVDRIRNHVKAGSQDLQAIGEAIINDVRQFVGNGPQVDDICLVCVQRHAGDPTLGLDGEQGEDSGNVYATAESTIDSLCWAASDDTVVVPDQGPNACG